MRIIKPSLTDVILDIGGYPDLWEEYGYKGRIVLLNLEKPEEYRALPSNCSYLQGDGRSLNFPDKSFDIVFSNSVIEHVGNWEDQKAFAAETSRVGKRYWIQTPNRNFLFEPHFNFPLFPFLPLAMRKWIAVTWPLSYYKRWGVRTTKELEESIYSTKLLTADDIRVLYPEGKLLKEHFLGFVKSIIAYHC